MMRISQDKLSAQLNNILCNSGVKPEASSTTIDALIQASLFGIDSHGVRLFPHYLGEVRSGTIDGFATPVYDRYESFIDCNANWGFSHFAARGLLTQLGEIASTHGIAIGTIRNSDHIGALGVHAFNARLFDFTVLGFTNANALASSPSGKNPVFGTNPISLVSGDEKGLTYVDLSTTIFTMNRVKTYAENQKELPIGVARSQEFLPTTDPKAAAFLEPIAGHKGFALAFMVETLTSGLTGGPHSISIPDMYESSPDRKRNLSHTFIVIDPRVVGNGAGPRRTAETTASSVEDDIREKIPGRKELSELVERAREGIPIDRSTRIALEKAGVRFD